MRNVALSEAKDNLSQYVTDAQHGRGIVITRHGKPAAQLVALADHPDRQLRARRALETLAEVRATMRAEGRMTSVDEMIAWKNEGRP